MELVLVPKPSLGCLFVLSFIWMFFTSAIGAYAGYLLYFKQEDKDSVVLCSLIISFVTCVILILNFQLFIFACQLVFGASLWDLAATALRANSFANLVDLALYVMIGNGIYSAYLLYKEKNNA